MAARIHDSFFGNSDLTARSLEEFKRNCEYLGSIFDDHEVIIKGYERAKLSWGPGFQPAWDVSTIERILKSTFPSMYSADAKIASENSLLWTQNLVEAFRKKGVSTEDKKIIQKALIAFTYLKDLYIRLAYELKNGYLSSFYLKNLEKYDLATDNYNYAINIIRTLTNNNFEQPKVSLLNNNGGSNLIITGQGNRSDSPGNAVVSSSNSSRNSDSSKMISDIIEDSDDIAGSDYDEEEEDEDNNDSKITFARSESSTAVSLSSIILSSSNETIETTKVDILEPAYKDLFREWSSR